MHIISIMIFHTSSLEKVPTGNKPTNKTVCFCFAPSRNLPYAQTGATELQGLCRDSTFWRNSEWGIQHTPHKLHPLRQGSATLKVIDLL